MQNPHLSPVILRVATATMRSLIHDISGDPAKLIARAIGRSIADGTMVIRDIAQIRNLCKTYSVDFDTVRVHLSQYCQIELLPDRDSHLEIERLKEALSYSDGFRIGFQQAIAVIRDHMLSNKSVLSADDLDALAALMPELFDASLLEIARVKAVTSEE